MNNFADIARKQNEKSIQNAKAVQEINQSYADRENRINGFAGSAGELVVRYSSRSSAATFGATGGNGTKVGK